MKKILLSILVLQFVLNSSTNLQASDQAGGETPLYVAAYNGHVDVVRELVNKFVEMGEVVKNDDNNHPPIYYVLEQLNSNIDSSTTLPLRDNKRRNLNEINSLLINLTIDALGWVP